MFSVNQQNNIEDFKFYLLWGDKTRRQLDLLNKNDVILAVNKAYIDMQPRTIDGLGLKLANGKNAPKKNKEYWDIVEFKNSEIKAIKDNLAAGTVQMIKNCCNCGFSQQVFDSNHNALCNQFIDQFRALIDTINDKVKEYNAKASSTNQIKNDKIDPEQITYGKAQKIVNMTFKYLSLFDNAKHFIHVFSLCHIAIDSYIIDEVKSLVGSCGILTSGRSETLKKVWSNYDKNDYENMLDLERKIIDSPSYNGEKVLFFEEFEWWRKAFLINCRNK